jgi:phosphotransferase system enzyme I (PtsI)
MILTGFPASPGIVIGTCYLMDVEKLKVKKHEITDSQIEHQILLFKEAVNKTREELIDIKEKIKKGMAEEYGDIFGAHLMVLEDPFLIIEVTQKIRNEKVNVEYALWEVLEMLTESFGSLEDEYMRERAVDIYDIGKRILQNLIKSKKGVLKDFPEGAIVVAHNLAPSETVQMHKGNVAGFATDIGGKTSHTAIMARALEIPAVVGLRNVTFWAKNGDTIIVDGNKGIVIINPDEKTIAEYKQKKKEFEDFKAGLVWLKDLPAQTLDGYRIELSANIEIPEEVDVALEHGATSIGLYRTEFLYLNRDALPSEEEQFKAYKEVLERMKNRSVIIRTLDLGGDKFLSYLDIPPEMNPFLGLRAIRLCLKHQDIFKTQLRALLRASNYGRLRIMFPMISCLEELIETKALLNKVHQELKEEGLTEVENVEIGVMIEIPSAAIIADILAQEVDFFSIGTNDLIQYVLAIDRINEEVAYLYNPLHPALLRLIKNIIEETHRHGKWVGMCGEMAGDPLAAIILLGLGLDEFSMSGVMIPKVKEVIRKVSLKESKEIADEVVNLKTAKEVEDALNRKFKDRFKYLFD